MTGGVPLAENLIDGTPTFQSSSDWLTLFQSSSYWLTLLGSIVSTSQLQINKQFIQVIACNPGKLTIHVLKCRGSFVSEKRQMNDNNHPVRNICDEGVRKKIQEEWS